MPATTNHPTLKRLGRRIRDLRNKTGLSQEAFADRARIDRSYMSGIERGVRNISVVKVRVHRKSSEGADSRLV